MIINVPVAVPDDKYTRADCLVQIIQSATFQLHQDALGIEQEELALTSRLNAIRAQVAKIAENDPLFK